MVSAKVKNADKVSRHLRRGWGDGLARKTLKRALKKAVDEQFYSGHVEISKKGVVYKLNGRRVSAAMFKRVNDAEQRRRADERLKSVTVDDVARYFGIDKKLLKGIKPRVK